MKIQDSLTDLQVEKIMAFCADKDMYEAVNKVILQGIYFHGTVQKNGTPDPLINGAFSLASLSMENPIPDAEIGAHLRAMWAGVNAMKNAFDTLKSIKKEEEVVESPYNQAV